MPIPSTRQEYRYVVPPDGSVVDGSVFPLRPGGSSAPGSVVRGEDIAFLLEALIERRHFAMYQDESAADHYFPVMTSRPHPLPVMPPDRSWRPIVRMLASLDYAGTVASAMPPSAPAVSDYDTSLYRFGDLFPSVVPPSSALAASMNVVAAGTNVDLPVLMDVDLLRMAYSDLAARPVVAVTATSRCTMPTTELLEAHGLVDSSYPSVQDDLSMDVSSDDPYAWPYVMYWQASTLVSRNSNGSDYILSSCSVRRAVSDAVLSVPLPGLSPADFGWGAVQSVRDPSSDHVFLALRVLVHRTARPGTGTSFHVDKMVVAEVPSTISGGVASVSVSAVFGVLAPVVSGLDPKWTQDMMDMDSVPSWFVSRDFLDSWRSTYISVCVERVFVLFAAGDRTTIPQGGSQ